MSDDTKRVGSMPRTDRINTILFIAYFACLAAAALAVGSFVTGAPL